jgi:hypothetical protein
MKINRTVRTSVIAVLLVLGCAAVLVDYGTVIGSCGGSSTWLSGQPQTYDEICMFPMDTRRRLFASLSAEKKVEFLREYWNWYLSSHSGLSLVKRQAIEEAIALLNTDLYTYVPGDILFGARVEVPRNRAMARASQVLSRSEMREIHFQLGPSERTGVSFASLRAVLGEKVRDLFTVAATHVGCDCNGDFYCGLVYGTTCDLRFGACTPAGGCGWNGSEQCYGACFHC